MSDDPELYNKVARLERLVQHLDHENRGVKKSLAQLARGENPNEIAVERESDTPWHCRKCGNLLGVYDEEEQVLRIRSREHYLWVKLGTDGWLHHPCRHCGEINQVFEVDGPDDSEGNSQ